MFPSHRVEQYCESFDRPVSISSGTFRLKSSSQARLLIDCTATSENLNHLDG